MWWQFVYRNFDARWTAQLIQWPSRSISYIASRGKAKCIFTKRSRSALWPSQPHPPPVGDGDPFTDSNDVGRKADYVVPPNGAVQNEWSKTSTLPFILRGVYTENIIIRLITRYLSLIWCYNAEWPPYMERSNIWVSKWLTLTERI